MRKKRVLLNWDTTRKDLLEPFLALQNDIEFVIIWGGYSEEDKKNHPFRQVYFTDYQTPYRLLDAVQPDKILFFNINSFTHVALNLAARNRGIPTYIMHHGIHHADQLEMHRKKEEMGMHKKNKLVSSRSTLWFYFSALRLKNAGQLFQYTRFAWLRQKRDRLLAVEKCLFDARLPYRYINLSPHNAIIIKKTDHIRSDEKFIYIGHPFFDAILGRLNALRDQPTLSAEKYFLLIDFPNIETHITFKRVTVSGKKAFYQRLSALAKARGYRLKIKLHPFGFNSPHNYQDENIDLIREADMAELIHGAEKCFSFFSTLIIPIIYHKGTCFLFFTGDDRELQYDLVELGAARRLDMSDFSEKDLADERPAEMRKEAYDTFINRYLYYTDGRATERLKNILLS